MPETTTSIEPIVKTIQTIESKAKEYVPRMTAGKEAAVSRLKSQYETILDLASKYDGSPSEAIDEAVSDVTETLSAAKEAYDKWNGWRTEMTKPMDEFKSQMMEFEKAVAYDGKTDNYYTKIRQQIVLIENKKIAKKREQEQVAQRKKEIENHKVDISTQVRKNLSRLIIDRIAQVDDGAKKYFDATTLDNFDEKAAQFSSFKPKLKIEQYDECFKPIQLSSLSADGQKSLYDTLVSEDPYEKWNEAHSTAILPTLNSWRSKIPQLKQQLVDIANAKSEQEAENLRKKKAQEGQAEQDRKDAELKQAQKQAEQSIDNEAGLSKMNNEFVAQATTQTLGDTAPVKWVYVVKDPKLMAKGLMNAIYHTLMNEKFKGIYKKDKSGNTVMDPETNKPKLIDEIDMWFRFVATNCDVELEGMEMVEVAKVTIKK